jgi:predicted nucleic acid-binding protein
MPGSFFDTNVLLYVVSADAGKADHAEKLIAAGGAISVQVLNEYANVARRQMGLSWAETRQLLQTIRALLSVHPVTAEVHETGLSLAERYGLSVQDGVIAASALTAGCDTLWSEAMPHDLLLEGQLRIRNPFAEQSR